MDTLEKRWSAGTYLRFLGAVASAVAVMAAVGYAVSTLRADGSMSAVAAALGATGLASAVSGIPLAFRGGPPQAVLNRSLFAMLIRLVLVAALAAFCVLGLGVDRGPFLVWLVVGYLALLAVDTAFSVRASRGPQNSL